MANFPRLSQKIIEYSFYTLFFVVPLILTPFNYELFEFNKMLVVYIFTTIIVGAWLAKMIFAKKFLFRHTFWDIPLLCFLASQLISFFFSIDRHTSFWGYYSRFNGGLLSLLCYALLYWAFVSNLNYRVTGYMLRVTLLSATLVAAYGIAEHFGIDAQYWVQDVRNRVFSTLGQPNWLAAWLAALAPLTWGMALNSKLKIKNFIFYFLFFTFYLCLLYTRSRSGLLGFTVAFFIFWLLAFWVNRQNRKVILRPFLIFTFSLFFLTFLTDYSWIPLIKKIKLHPPSPPSQINQSTSNPPLLISESGEIRKVVWKGAGEIWRHYPLFGTGPETFAYSYYWYRPREHNDLSEWDFLYNKAHNEYLNYAACTGTIGLVSYLLLILTFIFWVIKISKSEFLNPKQIPNPLPDCRGQAGKFQKKLDIGNYLGQLEIRIIRISLLSGFLSIAVTNFFGFSVVPVQLLFFLFPAFAVALASKEEKNSQDANKIPSVPKNIWAIVPLIFVIGYLLSTIFKYWRADTLFAKAEKLNKVGGYNQAFNLLTKAIKLRDFEPVYYDELGIAAANLALLAEKQNNTTLSANLVQAAIAASDKAIKISPYNLNFLKSRTKIFYKLAELNPYYYQEALNSLTRAAQLAPTEPKVRYNLGLIYLDLNQMEKAKEALEETIQLKPNYEDARYTLALIYEQKKEITKAREQMEYILNNINPQSQKAKEKLKELK